MTITSVEKAWSRSNGSLASGDGITVTASFTEGYQIVHSADATELEKLSATGLPQLGNYYAGTFIPCRRIGPSIPIGPLMSIMPIEYNGEIGVGGTDDNPLNQRPKISWTDATTNEPIDQDVNGRPIVTANGEQINGVTMDLADQIMTVTRNYATFSPWILHRYRHSVSSDTFSGFAAGTARMISFSAESQEASTGAGYWSVTAQIQFRYPYNTTSARAWWSRTRHEGFYERIGSALTFSGGGGSGAAAVPIVSSAGAITGVWVTAVGSGYTSVPTVAASIGTSATFTAVVANETVTSVTVTAGGSGYSSKIVRAVDSNKEPTSTPVLLKIDGTRETNPASTVWIETQRYTPLPYAALGLL